VATILWLEEFLLRYGKTLVVDPRRRFSTPVDEDSKKSTADT
jgi:hypothetical protein